MTSKQIWKVTAQGDTVYVKAVDYDDAANVVAHYIGREALRFCQFVKVDALPSDEELMNP